MILRADEGFILRNRHTGEKCKAVSVPTGWEDVYEQVEIDSDVSENVTNENKSILERLENVEKQNEKMQSEVSELHNVIKVEIKQLFENYLNLKTK